ncbi:hypothetical protein JTB14_021786 [Gonioctena quinquepunctata]|nr:hypothetical protein JTB14_021786 [Gonioctena quinquepunctata]
MFKRALVGHDEFTCLGDLLNEHFTLIELDYRLATWILQLFILNNDITHLKTVYLAFFVCAIQATQQSFRVMPKDVNIHEGGEAILKCEVANQAGQVQWAKDGYALGFSSEILGFPRYSVIGDRQHGVHNLRVINASLLDNAEYQCQVGPAKLQKIIRAKARLNVISPPSSVEILHELGNSTIEIKENQTLRLECRVRNAKPAAKIVWYRGSVEIKIPNHKDQTIAVRAKEGNQVIFRYDTQSQITLKPTAKDDSAEYHCEARQEALSQAIPMRATVQLSVLYPPGLPYIKGYTEGETIRRGQKIELVCRSRGGNPPAQLIWYKNGEQIRMAHRLAESAYTFTANASARYTCESTNVMSKAPLKAEIDLSVLYPPSAAFIRSYMKGSHIPLGTVQKFLCISSGGNPLATLTWYKNDKKIHSNVKRLDNNVTAEITILTNLTDNKARYRCEAFNSAMKKPVSGTFTMNVSFSPDHVKIRQEPEVLKPNEEGTLICDSSSSNPPAKLSWWREGIRVQELVNSTKPGLHGGTVSSIELKVNVTKQMNGIVYTCQANNEALQRSVHDAITLQVLYAASISKVSENVIVNPKENATLSCTADGNPLADDTITWKRDDFPDFASRTSVKYDKNGTSYLRISAVTRDDLGNFLCLVNNRVGNSSSKEIMLIVKHKPEVDEHPQYLKFASAAGDTSKLICRSQAFPLARYTWVRNGSSITPNTTGKYNSKFRQVNQLISESTLYINHVTSADYGLYECVARNELGYSTISPRLEVISAPDTPSLLTVLNVTHDTVTLDWTPAFDGGMKVSYRIRYIKVGDDVYKYEDAVGNNVTTYMVKGLEVNTQYVFAIMASNKLGNSKYMPDLLSAKTSMFNGVEKSISEGLPEKQDLQRRVIISVSVVAVVYLLINIGLVAGCMLKRRANRIRDRNNHMGELATIDKYTPSSNNVTNTEDTFPYVSERRVTFNDDGSHKDNTEENGTPAPNALLMDHQPDNPAANKVQISMQTGVNSALKTRHFHHFHHHLHPMNDLRPRTRDDQNLQYEKMMSVGDGMFQLFPILTVALRGRGTGWFSNISGDDLIAVDGDAGGDRSGLGSLQYFGI